MSRGRDSAPYRLVLLLAALLLVSATAPARAEVLLYRGEFVYLVPDALAQRMLELASAGAWQIFPRHTRRIDRDADGEHDFIAIGLGATGGYGAQVRYRLHHESDASRLGRWYWGVLTGPDGNKVFEVFNP